MTYEELMAADLGWLVERAQSSKITDGHREKVRAALCSRLVTERWDWLQFSPVQRAWLKQFCKRNIEGTNVALFSATVH